MKTVIFYIICFVSGFLIAFSISLIFLSQLKIVADVQYLSTIFGLFGAVGVLFTISKSIFELRSKPSLDFGQITMNLHHEYFIRVNKKGKDIAKNCEGIIKVGDIDANSMWGRDDSGVEC